MHSPHSASCVPWKAELQNISSLDTTLHPRSLSVTQTHPTMAIASDPMFPLRTVSSEQLQNLGTVMWDWELCNTCNGAATCSRPKCSRKGVERLDTFWNRYRTLTDEYTPEGAAFSRPALSSHDDLRRLIQAIRNGLDLTRERIIESHFSNPNSNGKVCTHAADQDRAMNIAASIMFMTNCGTSRDCADFLEEGGPSISWRSDVTATAFTFEAFPHASSSFVSARPKDTRFFDLLRFLAASKLVKAGFSLEPTDDLRSHLTIDYSGRIKTIRIFHCSAVLKEMLSAGRPHGGRCLIPRLLALEVLDTLHNILFPDDRSEALIQKYGFDSDLLRHDVSQCRRGDDPREFEHLYFGTRLREIYDELQNPTPHREWESWLERKSGGRYMLMATMIGVFIAVIIGLLGLGISGFQAYVSYQQWKHPVKDA